MSSPGGCLEHPRCSVLQNTWNVCSIVGNVTLGDRNHNVDRDTILKRLNAQAPALKQRYGLHSLAVFGSMARGDDHQGSDVDILATFEGPATFDRYMGLKLELEDLLGRPVDLGTPETLRPELWARVEKDLIRVA
jgi:predicted nucleotidyltransferase